MEFKKIVQAEIYFSSRNEYTFNDKIKIELIVKFEEVMQYNLHKS